MIMWSVLVTMIIMLSASVIKVVDRVDGRKTRREVAPPMMRMLTKKLMKKIIVREALLEKKMFSFGHCPKRGGGDPCPNFLTLFFHHVVPYILTSISCYVILFGHF